MRCRALCFLILVYANGAAAASSWDGTWTGGWENGDEIQIVIVGNKVAGIYRCHGSAEILSSDVSADGSMLSFWWVGGDGFLWRTDNRSAAISIRERHKPVRSFGVKRE